MTNMTADELEKLNKGGVYRYDPVERIVTAEGDFDTEEFRVIDKAWSMGWPASTVADVIDHMLRSTPLGPSLYAPNAPVEIKKATVSPLMSGLLARIK
jgi:hypothetical protein